MRPAKSRKAALSGWKVTRTITGDPVDSGDSIYRALGLPDGPAIRRRACHRRKATNRIGSLGMGYQWQLLGNKLCPGGEGGAISGLLGRFMVGSCQLRSCPACLLQIDVAELFIIALPG